MHKEIGSLDNKQQQQATTATNAKPSNDDDDNNNDNNDNNDNNNSNSYEATTTKPRTNPPHLPFRVTEACAARSRLRSLFFVALLRLL
jgi:hypothetical protein